MKQFKSLFVYGLIGYLFISSIVILLTYNVLLYFGKGGRKPITKTIEEKPYVLDDEPKKPLKMIVIILSKFKNKHLKLFHKLSYKSKIPLKRVMIVLLTLSIL